MGPWALFSSLQPTFLKTQIEERRILCSSTGVRKRAHSRAQVSKRAPTTFLSLFNEVSVLFSGPSEKPCWRGSKTALFNHRLGKTHFKSKELTPFNELFLGTDLKGEKTLNLRVSALQWAFSQNRGWRARISRWRAQDPPLKGTLFKLALFKRGLICFYATLLILSDSPTSA